MVMTCAQCGRPLRLLARLLSRATCRDCTRREADDRRVREEHARKQLDENRARYRERLMGVAKVADFSSTTLAEFKALKKSAKLSTAEQEQLRDEALAQYATTVLADHLLSVRDEE